MIIEINDLLNSGLPVSDELDERKTERAIFTAEQFVLKPRLGDSLYIDIINNPDSHTTILDGGVAEYEDKGTVSYKYVTGLKNALIEVSFALLLRDDITSTTFGSVLKKDDYSDQAGEERLNSVARYHYEVGLSYIKEITDLLKIDNTGKHLPNWYEEFL